MRSGPQPDRAPCSESFRWHGDSGDPPCGNGPLLANPAAFTLGEAAPDSELLTLLDREFEALSPHLTGVTDCLGLAGRCSSFREEQVGIRSPAIGVVLPCKVIDRKCVYETAVHDVHPLTYV